jgi:hypothetical protein
MGVSPTSRALPKTGMPSTNSGPDRHGFIMRQEEIDIFRIVDGKIAEVWHQEDRELGRLQQLGFIASPRTRAHEIT